MVCPSLREIVEGLGRDEAAEILAVRLWAPTLRTNSRDHGAARRARAAERFAVSFSSTFNILANDEAPSSNRA